MLSAPSVEFLARLPETTFVHEDTDAEFTVSLSSPDVDVIWMRNGVPIPEDERFRFIREVREGEHVRKLVVAHVDRDDIAEYTCVAGNVRTTTKLQVEDTETEFTLKLRDLVVRESDTVSLLVEVNRETMEVHWKKDGEEVEPSDKMIITTEGKNRKLIIKDAAASDQGVYSCVIKDKKCSSTVKVECPPKVRTEQRVFTARRGDQLELVVPYTAIPEPDILWTQNGKLLISSSTVKIQNDTQTTTLIFPKMDPAQVGTYHLRLKNKWGECSQDFVVVMLDRPEPPRELKTSEVGSDSVTLSWKPPDHDGGAPITNYQVEYHDRNTSKWIVYKTRKPITETFVRVQSLNEAHDYTFRVSAENDVGRSEPSQNSEYVETRDRTGDAPAILEHLPDETHARRNEVAVLVCRIGGQPQPEIVWLKDGADLKLSRRMKACFDDHVALLTITDITEDDAGLYSCHATNQFGKASTVGCLAIKGRHSVFSRIKLFL